MQAGIKQQVLIDALVPDFGLSSKMGIYAREAILILGFAMRHEQQLQKVE